MIGKIAEMEDVLGRVKADMIKFLDKDNNAAGTRVRVAMQDIKKLAQEVRIMVIEKKQG
jgi:hypothetical protein